MKRPSIIKIYFLLAGILLSVNAPAQHQGVSDSIWTYHPAAERYHHAAGSIAALESYTPVNAGVVGLLGSYEAGGLRFAQVPQKQQVVSFETAGMKTVSRFRLYGKFTYSRTWDDSLAWTQTGLPDHNRPYYFAARKAGNYDRQYYHMNGLASYTLKPGKLYIGSGIDYLYNTAFRSIDPRPAVKNFALLISPGIAWKTGSHTLGITPTLGYGYESNSNSYINSQYRNNYELYPERRTWLMMGMGYMQPRAGSNDGLMVARTGTAGLRADDIYTTGQWTFSSNLSWQRDKTTYSNAREKSLTDMEWGSYTLNTCSFRLLAQQQLRHTISITATARNGEDLNTYAVPPLIAALNAKNYEYQYKNLMATYSHINKTGRRLVPGWGTSLQWETESKRDFVTAHRIGYSNITPALSGELYGHPRNGDRFNIQLSAGIKFPLSQDITVLPTQVTAFSTDVVFHDYYFQSIRSGILSFRAQYITGRIFHTIPAGVAIHINYSNRLGNAPEQLAGIPVAGANRLLSSLSFNLFL